MNAVSSSEVSGGTNHDATSTPPPFLFFLGGGSNARRINSRYHYCLLRDSILRHFLLGEGAIFLLFIVCYLVYCLILR
jgi:hypothetical protein